MITERVRTLIGRIKAAGESLDVEAFLTLLAEDVVFRLGAQPPVHGKAAVRAVVTGLFASLAGLHHEVGDTIVEGDRVVFEAEVTYRFRGSGTLTLPYADVLRLDAQGLVRDYRIYIDLSPLAALQQIDDPAPPRSSR